MTPIQELDRAGIERMIANRVSMNAALPRERFLWVAYADALMYPFPAEPLIHNSDQKAFFDLEGGALGEKFEMAYLRSLDIGNPSRADAESAWRGGARTEAQYRVLQDFLFHAIALECGRLGRAVHFHTGTGAGGFYNAGGGNPNEALAQLQKPNVYLDFSVRQSDLARAIRSWLEFAPEKVMFGTDAYPYGPGLGWEETAIAASDASREALGIALTRMVRE